MTTPGYINLHTHWPAREEDAASTPVLSIVNTYPGEAGQQHWPAISCGIHPWYIQAGTWEQEFEQLQALARLPRVMAVGECGLDALKGPDMALQKTVFLRQLVLAKEVDKPVIIHCVRAYEALLHLAQDLEQMPVCIVHGFQKSPELAQDLLKRGFYLSLGSVFLKTPEAMPDYRDIPLERIFLETDDRDIPIKSIYQQASRYWQIPEEALMAQIQQNFRTVFQHA